MSDSKYPDEQTLVAGLKAGDRDAFREAVSLYSNRMLATARAIVGPANADDVVQDAWLTVFQQIGKFEQRSTLSTWLQRIVANRAISVLRSGSREQRATAVDPTAEPSRFDESGHWATPPKAWDAATPEALLAADALQDCIDKHLLEMPVNQRNVMVLRDMQQMSFDEICNETDLTASNVRVLLHRGRKRLIEMVSVFEETGSC